MNRKKVEELRWRISELRGQAQVPTRELEKIAEALGRTRRRKPGGHQIFEMRGRPPLSIPHHSKPLKRFTKDNILTVLEGDLAAIEASIQDGGE